MRVPLYSHGYQLKIPKALSHFKGTALNFELFHILRLLFMTYSMKRNLSVRNIYNSIHHNKQIIVGQKSPVLFRNSALRPILMFDCCHRIALLLSSEFTAWTLQIVPLDHPAKSPHPQSLKPLLRCPKTPASVRGSHQFLVIMASIKIQIYISRPTLMSFK